MPAATAAAAAAEEEGVAKEITAQVEEIVDFFKDPGFFSCFKG